MKCPKTFSSSFCSRLRLFFKRKTQSSLGMKSSVRHLSMFLFQPSRIIVFFSEVFYNILMILVLLHQPLPLFSCSLNPIFFLFWSLLCLWKQQPFLFLLILWIQFFICLIKICLDSKTLIIFKLLKANFDFYKRILYISKFYFYKKNVYFS